MCRRSDDQKHDPGADEALRERARHDASARHRSALGAEPRADERDDGNDRRRSRLQRPRPGTRPDPHVHERRQRDGQSQARSPRPRDDRGPRGRSPDHPERARHDAGPRGGPARRRSVGHGHLCGRPSGAHSIPAGDAADLRGRVDARPRRQPAKTTRWPSASSPPPRTITSNASSHSSARGWCFCIDWNRARKRLTRLVSKTDALALLKWAADNNIGHLAFLKAGDVQLVETAIERAFAHDMRPGARLDQWLGADAARSFLMSVLRTTSSGLAAGYSLSLIEDEIEAELLRYLQSNDRQMLADAADHAAMISALDDHVRQTLGRMKSGDGHDEASRTAELALSWTARAEQIVRHAGRWLHDSDERSSAPGAPDRSRERRVGPRRDRLPADAGASGHRRQDAVAARRTLAPGRRRRPSVRRLPRGEPRPVHGVGSSRTSRASC